MRGVFEVNEGLREAVKGVVLDSLYFIGVDQRYLAILYSHG